MEWKHCWMRNKFPSPWASSDPDSCTSENWNRGWCKTFLEGEEIVSGVADLNSLGALGLYFWELRRTHPSTAHTVQNWGWSGRWKENGAGGWDCSNVF